MFEEINERAFQDLSLSKYVHYYSTFYYHCFLGAALDIILIVETKYLIKST